MIPIFLNAELWLIIFVSPYHASLLMPDGRYTLGVTDRRYNSIMISNAIHGEKLKEVLQHELSHAILFTIGSRMVLSEEERLASFTGKYSDEISELAQEVMLIYEQ